MTTEAHSQEVKILDRNEYEVLRTVAEREGATTAGDILNALVGRNSWNRQVVIPAAYILYRASEEGIEMSSLDSFCETAGVTGDRTAYFRSTVDEYWPILANLRFRYSPTVL